MPYPCRTCSHPDVVLIDDALRADVETQDAIARRFNVTPQALSRHRARHLKRRAASVTSGRPGASQRVPADALDLPTETIALLSREEFVNVICHESGRDRGGFTPIAPELPGSCFDELLADGRHEELSRRPGARYDEWVAEQAAARRRP